MRGLSMADQNSSSGEHGTTLIFNSDLSPRDQREQLVKLISDFSERLETYEDGEEKRTMLRRLDRLKDDLLLVQDILNPLASALPAKVASTCPQRLVAT
jgi:hypothetical protein